MRLALLVQLSWRNIWRYRRRNSMMLMAILIAVSMIVLANALIRGWQVGMVDSVVGNLTGHVKVMTSDYRVEPSIQHGFVPPAQWQPQISSENLLGWTARVVVPGVIVSERDTRGVQLVGINPGEELPISFLGSAQIEGDMLDGVDDARILLGKALAEQLRTRLGRRVVLMSQGGDGRNREAGFRIAGLYDSEGIAAEKMIVFLGRESLQAMLGSDNVTEISLRLRDDELDQSVRDGMQFEFKLLQASTWDELEPQAAALFKYADVAILVWFGIMMTALAFGLVNTLVTAVMERVKELGMLRALGMRAGMVVTHVVIECLLIVVIGVLMGLLLGIIFVYRLRDGIDLGEWAAGIEAFHVQTLLVPHLVLGDLLMVLGLSLLFGLLASVYPAWRAVRVSPLDAMRR
jgi:ABC-type lipoprotein release transport system permease subunit